MKSRVLHSLGVVRQHNKFVNALWDRHVFCWGFVFPNEDQATRGGGTRNSRDADLTHEFNTKMNPKSKQQPKPKKVWKPRAAKNTEAVAKSAGELVHQLAGAQDALTEIKEETIREGAHSTGSNPPEPKTLIEGGAWVTYHDPTRKPGWTGWLLRGAEQLIKLPSLAALRVATRVDSAFGGAGAYVAGHINKLVPHCAAAVANRVDMPAIKARYSQLQALPTSKLFGDIEIFVRDTFSIVDDTGCVPCGRFRLVEYCNTSVPTNYEAPTLLSGAKISETPTTLGIYEIQAKGTCSSQRVLAYTEIARQLSVKNPLSEVKRVQAIEKQTFNALSPVYVDADLIPFAVAGTKIMARLFGIDLNTHWERVLKEDFHSGGLVQCTSQVLTILVMDTELERSLFALLSLAVRTSVSGIKQTAFLIGKSCRGLLGLSSSAMLYLYRMPVIPRPSWLVVSTGTAEYNLRKTMIDCADSDLLPALGFVPTLSL